jgi:hypothetical protein
MKTLLVTALMTILLGVVLGVWTTSAQAFSEPPVTQQPYYTKPDENLIAALQRARTETDMSDFERTFAGDSAETAQVGAARAGMAARVLPAMRVLGSIGLGVSTFDLGWKIGSSIYMRWVAPGIPTTSLITGYTWTYSTNNSGYEGPVGDGTWVIDFSTPAFGIRRHVPDGAYTGGNATIGALNSSVVPTLALVHGIFWYPDAAFRPRTVSAEYGGSYGSTETGTIILNDDGMADAGKLKPMTAGDWAANGHQRTSGFSEPAHTSDDATAARTKLTNGSRDTRDYINHILDPGYGESDDFTPFLLPEPQLTETYSQYVARLRAFGWVGTLTIDPAAALEAAADPASDYAQAPIHAPAGVLVGSAPIVWHFDVGAPRPGDHPDPTWPDNPPRVPQKGTPITIKEKPPATIFPPPVGGGGGDCPCDIAAIDFSPLTSLDFTNNFPFGVPGWFASSYSALSVGTSCFDFDLDKPGAIGGGVQNVSLCSAQWEDSYRPWVFPLILALMTVGAFLFLGTKVIKIQRGVDD